jgi:hypothetical protein
VSDALALLAAAGTFPPLTDPGGEPYDPELLPCTQQPHRWDAAADWPERVRAIAACQACPALAACRARRHTLDGLVAGVIAAEDIPEPVQGPRVYDAAVAAWLARAGVVLKDPPAPSGRRRRKVGA